MFDRTYTYNIFRCARNVYQQTGPKSTLLFPGASGDYLHSALRLLQNEHDLTSDQLVKVPFSGRAYEEIDFDLDTLAYEYTRTPLADQFARNTPGYAKRLKRRGITMKKLLARPYLEVIDFMEAGLGTATFLGVLYDMAKAEGCEREFLAKTRVLAFSQVANCNVMVIKGTPGNPNDTIRIPVERTEAAYPYPSAPKWTLRRDKKDRTKVRCETEEVFRQTPQLDMSVPNPRLHRTNWGIMPLLARRELRRYYREELQNG